MKKKEEVVIKKPESYKTLLEHFKMSQESLKKSQEMTNLMLQNFNQEREEDRKVRLAEIEEKKQERFLQEQQIILLKEQLAQSKSIEQKPSGSGMSRPGDLKSSLNVDPPHWLKRNRKIPRITDCTNRVRTGLQAMRGKETYYKQAIDQCVKEVKDDIKHYEALGFEFVQANPEKKDNLYQKACDMYQIGNCDDKCTIGGHRDRSSKFFFLGHICDLCNKLRGANFEHSLMECDILIEFERLEHEVPTNDMDSFFFRKINKKPENEPNKNKPIKGVEPETVTSPELAHDIQILMDSRLDKTIKKETQD
jgi:hypothetical protein